MGFKDLLILGLTHPGDLRVLAQYWLYDERRDITLPSEYEATRYDQKTMRRCWELLDMTSRSFSAVINDLYNYSELIFHMTIGMDFDVWPVNPKNKKPAGMISKETYEIVMKNAEVLDSAIIYDRDFNYN